MCGIFGQVSIKQKPFDYTAFCTLGIHNDLRGGDSCGVFIDGQVEYGVNDKKLFEDFFETSKLVQTTRTASIALGHCRKASIGAIGESTAQPVVITNKDGKVEFVVIHNGTIYNYAQLAAKYIPEIDIKGMTDSQVMTHIFYYKGYDVLNEYNGGAVFVIVDYRGESPEILLWKGASPTTYTGAPSEERPLYVAIGKDELLFSSIYTFLPVLRRDANIAALTENILCRYTGVDLEIVKEYDRKNQFQYNRTNYTVYQPSSFVSNKSNVSAVQSGRSGYIYCSTKDGKCFNNGNIVHGLVKCSIFGNICAHVDEHEMYFWNGILLKNKACFDYLSLLAQEFGCTPQEIDDIYSELPLYFSPFPYKRTSSGIIEIVDSPISSSPLTGKYRFPFTAVEYTVNEGKLIGNEVKSVSEGMKHYFEHKDDAIPYEILCSYFGIISEC